LGSTALVERVDSFTLSCPCSSGSAWSFPRRQACPKMSVAFCSGLSPPFFFPLFTWIFFSVNEGDNDQTAVIPVGFRCEKGITVVNREFVLSLFFLPFFFLCTDVRMKTSLYWRGTWSLYGRFGLDGGLLLLLSPLSLREWIFFPPFLFFSWLPPSSPSVSRATCMVSLSWTKVFRMSGRAGAR